jgi:hypothetical protein
MWHRTWPDTRRWLIGFVRLEQKYCLHNGCCSWRRNSTLLWFSSRFILSRLMTFCFVILTFLYCFVFVSFDSGYVPFVVITIRFFPHSWRTTGFLTRVTRRVSRGQKELPTLSYSVFRDVRVVQSFVLWIVFYRSLFVLLSFYIGHCTVWPSSMYSFSFPL